MENTITIPIEVMPDLVMIKHEKERYGDKMIYRKYTYLFEHDLCLKQTTDDEGNPVGYSEKEYFAIRFKHDKVQTLDIKHGWLTDLEATQEYSNIIAEKELLK